MGTRPIDLHLKGLDALNVIISEENGKLIASTEKLMGNTINFDFPSVGATENILIAAVLAEGTTTIINAAREPEIIDLANFLNSMGAKVKGAGSSTITVSGVKKLYPTEYKVMNDRIALGTFLIGTAITGGEVTFNDIDFDNIEPILSKLTEAGCMTKKFEKEKKLILKSTDIILPLKKVQTYPHPGLPTDIQPQLMSLLSIAKGSSMIIENIFESRNKHVSELIKLGADIRTSNNGQTFVINGVKELFGANVFAKDLRGGAALILAGLCANGKTIVNNSHYVERGYESIEKTLSTVGANIELLNIQ